MMVIKNKEEKVVLSTPANLDASAVNSIDTPIEEAHERRYKLGPIDDIQEIDDFNNDPDNQQAAEENLNAPKPK